MRHLLIAGVLVLASTAHSSAQAQLHPAGGDPINITFVGASLDEALTFIAQRAGVTIEFDATVTEDMRRAPLAKQPIRLLNTTVDKAIDALTSTNGLTYTITGPKAVRISKKA
jgi:hypothetical protein